MELGGDRLINHFSELPDAVEVFSTMPADGIDGRHDTRCHSIDILCQTEKLRKAVLEKYPDTRFNEEQRRMTDDELVVFLSDRDAAIMGRAAIDGIEDTPLPEPGVFPFRQSSIGVYMTAAILRKREMCSTTQCCGVGFCAGLRA